MLRATLHRFGRLGFVGALLLALATVALPVESRACAPNGTDATAVTAGPVTVVEAGFCGHESCGDCAAVCAHGCCHAPHLALMIPSAATLSPTVVGEPLAAPEAMAAPLATVPTLERPPRA